MTLNAGGLVSVPGGCARISAGRLFGIMRYAARTVERNLSTSALR